MSGKTYILVNRKPLLCEDILKWAVWFQTANRVVAHTLLTDLEPRERAKAILAGEFKARATVSTVFLGTDVSFGDIPILFETVVFAEGSPLDGHQDRYPTWEVAEDSHQKAVRMVQQLHPNWRVTRGG